MSATTRAVSARTASGTSAPLQVALVGLLATVRTRHPRRRVDRAAVERPRPSRWYHGPIVGPSPASSRSTSLSASCRTVSMPNGVQPLGRSSRRPPTARSPAGRPSRSNHVSLLIRKAPRGLPKSVAILACSLLSPIPTEQCSSVAARTCSRICCANPTGRDRSCPPAAAPRRTPRPSPAPRRRPGRRPTSSDLQGRHHTADAASYAGGRRAGTPRRGHFRARDAQRHARPDAVLAGLVRRGRHDRPLGRVAPAADDDRRARPAPGAAASRPRR